MTTRTPAAALPAIADGPLLVAGIGASFGVSVDELRSLLEVALAGVGLTPAAIDAFATVEAKANEEALLVLAREYDVPLLLHPAAKLSRVAVPHPSDRVAEAVGTVSVAEAAALLGSPDWKGRLAEQSAELLVDKTASPRATVAIARHWLADLRHHGDAELGPDLLDLAVNVAPDPLPDWLAGVLREACANLRDYPDARPATAAVAQRHGRTEDEVLLTAGAAEAFTLIAQGLTRGKAVIVHPQFTEPEVALRASGWQIERVVLKAEDWFQLDPTTVAEDATLVVIGNPTNPTGVLHPRETLRQLRRPGRVLLVDEAFMDLVPDEPQSLADDPDLDGIVVVRSLTKTWGLAGLRIGYLLGDPAAIAAAAAVQPHWSVSSPALAAAAGCMSAEGVREGHRRAVALTEQRGWLSIALAERGFEVAPDPAGPFVLTRHPKRQRLHAELRSAGIAVRRADTFPGLGPGWVRISVRDDAAMRQLLTALDGASSDGASSDGGDPE